MDLMIAHHDGTVTWIHRRERRPRHAFEYRPSGEADIWCDAAGCFQSECDVCLAYRPAWDGLTADQLELWG